MSIQIINNSNSAAQTGRLLIAVLAIAALIAAGLSVIPFGPAMSTTGVDVWPYAMNDAVARHLVFGRDVIFTFGPLASIYTQLYHPATYPITLIGCTVFAIGLCAGFALLAFEKRPLLLLLVPFLGPESWSRDATLMIPPLLLLMAGFRISLPEGHRDRIELRAGSICLLLLLSVSLGILPLVKGSFSALVAGEFVIASAMLASARHFKAAVAIAATILLSIVVSWTIVGQPIEALPHYFVAQSQIISGYSEAMSSQGPVSQVYHWLIAAVLILGASYVCLTRRRGMLGVFLLLGLVLFMFVNFKSGFVRQDMHPRIAAAAFLTITLILATTIPLRQALLVALISLSGWVALEHSFPDFRSDLLIQRPHDVYSPLYDMLGRRITGEDSFPQMYASAQEEIHKISPLEGVKGTADIYPYKLDILFANNLLWSPRPVIQSYSAYTPSLDRGNANHLVGDNAPQNVFFTVIGVDHRLPSIEDALSWPELLARYSVVDRMILSSPQQVFLHLVRRSAPLERKVTLLMDSQGSIGAPIPIPPSAGIVVAKVTMRPNVLGRAVLAFYKLPDMFIDVTLTDGQTHRFRYVPSMGETGFILSPLVTSSDDFAKLAAGQSNFSRVKQITFTTTGTRWWSRNFHVILDTMQLGATVGSSSPAEHPAM